MVNWIYKNCDKVLVQSRGFVKYAIKSGARKSTIQYLPNWAESIYKPNLENNKISNALPKNGFNIMFAGNIGVAQSINTIIQCAENLKNININWIFIGDGRQKKNLISRVNKKNLSNKFYFISQKPVEDMPYYFNYADVLLVTLLSRPIFNSTIPGKIQSYLACGKPIVASLDGEGAKIINESKSGIAVKAEDYKKLSSAIIQMNKMSTKELKKLGENALRYYKNNFHREELIKKIEKIMNNEIKKND